MALSKLDLRGDAYRKVLGFMLGHWAHQPWRVGLMFALFMLATMADVLTPLYAAGWSRPCRMARRTRWRSRPRCSPLRR